VNIFFMVVMDTIMGLHARDFIKSWQIALFLGAVTFIEIFCLVA
jgi:hypothetical protein